MVAATIAAAVCLVAAGCTGSAPGADEDPLEPSPSGSSPAGSGPISLRFAVYGDRALVASYVDLAEAFTRKNPQVRIKVEHTRSAATATADLDREFAERTAPDVFLLGTEELPRMVAADRVQPVDALLEEREVDFGDAYQRDGLEAFSGESALQCMPSDVSPAVVYYNTALLNLRALVEEGDEPLSARTGWSFTQFATAARRIAKGSTIGLHIEPDPEALAPFIWSGGGDLVDDLDAPTSLALSDGDAPGALAEVLALIRDTGVAPTRVQLARQGAVDLFEQGRLGMIIGTRQLTPGFRDAEGLSFEVFPIPSLGSFRTISTITGYCMSSETEHVEAAADFIAFAVGRQGATITSLSGYVVPSNVEVVQSPAFSQPDQQPRNFFVFSEAVRLANETPLVPEWPRVVRESRPFIDRMFYAPVIDLETLLAKIDAQSQAILAPEVPPEETPEVE
ncbi:MAG TPA: extracellular solute-binding protein [Nocardioidaceae bacterium]|nr:extracellular solute-binding protein [Nocardioidaceae bacterium]